MMIVDVRMKLVCWCLLSIRFIYIHQFSDAINDYVDESFITPSVVADYYQHLFELLLTSAPPHEEYDHREGSQSSSVIGPMRMMTEFCVLVVEYDVIHGVHHHRRHHQQRLKHHQQHININIQVSAIYFRNLLVLLSTSTSTSAHQHK